MSVVVRNWILIVAIQWRGCLRYSYTGVKGAAIRWWIRVVRLIRREGSDPSERLSLEKFVSQSLSSRMGVRVDLLSSKAWQLKAWTSIWYERCCGYVMCASKRLRGSAMVTGLDVVKPSLRISGRWEVSYVRCAGGLVWLDTSWSVVHRDVDRPSVRSGSSATMQVNENEPEF